MATSLRHRLANEALLLMRKSSLLRIFHHVFWILCFLSAVPKLDSFFLFSFLKIIIIIINKKFEKKEKKMPCACTEHLCFSFSQPMQREGVRVKGCKM
jgi:hypothetical protein